jgi:hypothetical protein
VFEEEQNIPGRLAAPQTLAPSLSLARPHISSIRTAAGGLSPVAGGPVGDGDGRRPWHEAATLLFLSASSPPSHTTQNSGVSSGAP